MAWIASYLSMAESEDLQVVSEVIVPRVVSGCARAALVQADGVSVGGGEIEFANARVK